MKPALLALGGLGAWAAYRALSDKPNYSLDSRTVLVTGGSRGLGLVLAREAAREGARVAICGRDPESLERARKALERFGGEIEAVVCDVTDPGSVQRMIETVTMRFGPVDVLINNAGVIEVGPAETMTVSDFREALTTNFWGMLYPTLEVLPLMRARRDGRILNITSIGGKVGIPHLLPYSVSKFAAVGFTQALRAEVARDGVKVIAVVPGLMRTGSPRNAIFRGRHKSEYAWFSIADSLPGLSISAERAARRILRGLRRGDAEVLFPLSSRIAAVFNAAAPNLTSRGLALVSKLLPSPAAAESGRRKGEESQSVFSPSWLTRLGDRAARRYNQIGREQPAG